MKYYRTEYKGIKLVYFLAFNDTLNECTYVEPNEKIEFEDAEIGEVCFAWEHYHSQDNVTLVEVNRDDFMQVFVETRNFLQSKIEK